MVFSESWVRPEAPLDSADEPHTSEPVTPCNRARCLGGTPELREEAIPSSMYVIPEDYTETPMMANMPEGYEGYGQQGQQPPSEDDQPGGLSGLFKKSDG